MPIVNNQFEYEIPKIIQKKMTKNLLQLFREKLDEKFQAMENDDIPTYLNFYVYLESTTGWKECFKQACVESETIEVYDYYEELEWYNADLFDDELSLMLLNEGVVEEGGDPEIEDYLKK